MISRASLHSHYTHYVHSRSYDIYCSVFFFFQAEDGIRDSSVTGVQTCALPIFDYKALSMSTNGRVVKEGEWVTLDGSEGVVYTEAMPLVVPELPEAYETLMKWADETRRLKVRTNVDTPQDARKAIEFGAEGIGLCRTEHMFFTDFEQPERSHERQRAIQEMILADNREARVKA